MKQRAKFTMFVLSAAVLAGAWLLADPTAGLRDAAAEPEPSTEPISLAVGTAEELTALSWSWEGQTVNLRRERDSGLWEDADDPNCPIDPEAAEALAEAAASATAAMAVEDVTDMERYGLKPPSLTVIAATSETAASYEVGNMSVTGEYYVRRDGEDTVYLEKGSLAAFRVGLDELLALDEIPAELTAVTELSVASEAGSYRIAYRVRSDGGTGWYRSDGGAAVPLEQERVRDLLEPLLDTALDRCVDWKGTEPGLYGLDEPQLTAEVKYLDETGKEAAFSVAFGDYAEGGIYASISGSDAVYLTSALAADTLMYPDWDRLTVAAALTLDTEDIASAAVTLGGTEYELLRLEEETERPVGDGSVAVTDVIWSMNGWVLDTDAVEDWLVSLAGLPAEAVSSPGEGRQTLLRAELRWKDAESVPAELELRSYDSAHCLCIVGGDRYMLVSRTAAEAVIAAAGELFSSE